MIKYKLICSLGHEFVGWFQNGAAFDVQQKDGRITCPVCGTAKVTKAVMAPNVATRSGEPSSLSSPDAREELRRLRAELTLNAEDVGERFAQEARKIHFDEAEPRQIYGEASREDVKSLLDDGVPVLPLPRLPEDAN